MNHNDVDDDYEIIRLLTAARLAIGYAAEVGPALTRPELQELHKRLCRVSELLDLPALAPDGTWKPLPSAGIE